MNEERIKELFSNEEYVKGLFELGSYEKVSEKLAEDGVEASPEELKKVVELLKKKESGELSDVELEEVAGGLTPFAFTMLFSATMFVFANGCGVVWYYASKNNC